MTMSSSLCRSLVPALGCLGALLWLTGCAGIPSSETAPEPAIMTCRYTSTPIQVDGLLDDAWNQADIITPFVVPREGTVAESLTVARMLWDDQYLYVYFSAQDLDIWAYHDERDQATCRDDVLEVFVKPDTDGEGYANFEINVLGTVYDAYAPRENTPMGQRWRRWDCQGLKIATKVFGTLNNYSDKDEQWTLEVAIPFAELPPCNGTAPLPGTRWRILLARYDYSIYKETGVELSAATPLSKPNFHVPEEWGWVEFVR